jgi:hypothetical protein
VGTVLVRNMFTDSVELVVLCTKVIARQYNVHVGMAGYNEGDFLLMNLFAVSKTSVQ